jgi:hypothetical protein
LAGHFTAQATKAFGGPEEKVTRLQDVDSLVIAGG